MSSNAITEKPEAERWNSVGEAAPSVLRADEPTVARAIGFVGLLFAVLGVVAIGFDVSGSQRIVGGGTGSLLALLGLLGLLYHAARDTELQVRRAYGALALLLLVGAVVAAVYPAVPSGIGAATEAVPGARFLPWGAVSLIGSLLFFLPYIRNETEEKWHRGAVYLVGAAGLAMAGTGLIGGNVSLNFLLPTGLLLAVFGLAYLWVFISSVGTESETGARVSLGIAVAGAVVMIVAIGRCLATRGGWFGVTRDLGYLATAGVPLLAVGVLYVAAAFLLYSDRVTAVLTRRELTAAFFTPMAYFVLFGFAFMGWLAYWGFVNVAERATQMRQPIVEPIIIYYFFGLVPVICFILTIPLLTMGTFSEEQRTQTIEVLLTAPVEETPVVLGKFFASLILYALAWLPFMLYLLALRMESKQNFDYRPLISFSLGLLCSGAAWISLGLFFSSLSRSQLVAGALTAMAMVTLTVIFLYKDQILSPGSAWQPVLTYFSYINLWQDTLEGRLSLGTLAFNVSVAIFWLFVTVKVLESRKWR